MTQTRAPKWPSISQIQLSGKAEQIFVSSVTSLADAMAEFKEAAQAHISRLGGLDNVSAVSRSSDAGVTRTNDKVYASIERTNMATNLLLAAHGMAPGRILPEVLDTFPELENALQKAVTSADVIPSFLKSFRDAFPALRRIAKYIYDPVILTYFPVALAGSMGFPIPRNTNQNAAPLSIFAPFGGIAGARNLPCAYHCYSYFLSTTSFVAAASIPLNALLGLVTLQDPRKKLVNDLEFIDMLVQNLIDWADLDELLDRDGVKAATCTEAPEQVEKIAMLLSRIVRANPKKWKAHMDDPKRASSGLPTKEALFSALDRVAVSLKLDKTNPSRQESAKLVQAHRVLLSEACDPERAASYTASASQQVKAEVAELKAEEEQMSRMSLGICDFCHLKAAKLKMCSRCKVAWYCSPEHQKLAWKEHKADCQAR